MVGLSQQWAKIVGVKSNVVCIANKLLIYHLCGTNSSHSSLATYVWYAGWFIHSSYCFEPLSMPTHNYSVCNHSCEKLSGILRCYKFDDCAWESLGIRLNSWSAVVRSDPISSSSITIQVNRLISWYALVWVTLLASSVLVLYPDPPFNPQGGSEFKTSRVQATSHPSTATVATISHLYLRWNHSPGTLPALHRSELFQSLKRGRDMTHWINTVITNTVKDEE